MSETRKIAAILVARLVGADPDDVDADDDAERRQQLSEEGERSFRSRDPPRQRRA